MYFRFDQIGSFIEPHRTQAGDNSIGFLDCSVPAFLGMDRFEHASDLTHFRFGNMAKDVAVKMHRTALPACLRQILGHDQPDGAGKRSNRSDKCSDRMTSASVDLASLRSSKPSNSPRGAANGTATLALVPRMERASSNLFGRTSMALARLCDGIVQSFNGSCTDAPEVGLEFRERHFDRVQIWTIGGQECSGPWSQRGRVSRETTSSRFASRPRRPGRFCAMRDYPGSPHRRD